MSAAREAHAALNKAIDERRAVDLGLPCDGDDRFLADDAAERRQAARICNERCPIQSLCAQAGRREHHGVWGGIDRTPVTRERRR